MFTVDFWYPILIKIDDIKEEYILDREQVIDLDIIESIVYNKIHIGNYSESDYIEIHKEIVEFRKKLTKKVKILN